jgi:DNA-binding IclR family transcriptional regulator
MSTKKDKSDYTIQTVANALRLLEEFEGEEELGVTELSRRLVLHKNNVFRLLATLEQRGYIEQRSENDRYGLGVRCLALAQAYSGSHDLLRRGRPILRELSRTTGESAHLGLLKGRLVVHVDGVASGQLVATASRVGQSLPVHGTALGKVLLGCSSEEVRKAYDHEIDGEELPRLTDQTIVDRDKFFEHVRSVAVRGFALDLEECEDGLTCAAAPVYDPEGRVVPAISVSGPAFRLDEERLRLQVVPSAIQAAEHLSRDLGFGAS